MTVVYLNFLFIERKYKIQMVEEIWKEINHNERLKGFYQVSNMGRVRSKDRYFIKKYNKVGYRKGTIKSTKYSKVYDCRVVQVTYSDGTHSKLSVARLVLNEFYKKTKDEEEYNTVLYLDGDKNNCKLSNLKWSLSETSTSKYYRGVWADITPLPEGWSKYILIKGEIPKEYPYLTGKSGIYTAASKGTTYKGYRWTKYE
jgi:hypothetical protein